MDTELDALLEGLPAVSLEGPKAVGKTETALRRARTGVKLSATVDEADTRHLAWLADRLGPDLLDAAVITTGHEAYRRADGIDVIPAGLLTA